MPDNLEELLHIYDQTFYLPAEGTGDLEEPTTNRSFNVLVLLQEGDLNQDTEPMLQKMLQACQVDSNQYTVQTANQQSVVPVLARFNPEYLLLFGLKLQSETFLLHKENYTPFRFAGKKVLHCDSLVQIHAKPALKSILWTQGLKPLFNIL